MTGAHTQQAPIKTDSKLNRTDIVLAAARIPQ